MGNRNGKIKSESSLHIKQNMIYYSSPTNSIKNEEKEGNEGGYFHKSKLEKIKKSQEWCDMACTLADLCIHIKNCRAFNSNLYYSCLIFDCYENVNDYSERELSYMNQMSSLENCLNIPDIQDGSSWRSEGNDFNPDCEIEYNMNVNVNNNANSSENNIVHMSVNSSTNVDNQTLNLLNMSLKNLLDDKVSISAVNQSNLKIFNKDKSFDDLNLQDYLNLETERLKKEIVKNGTQINQRKKEENQVNHNFAQNNLNDINYQLNNINILKNKNLEMQQKRERRLPISKRKNIVQMNLQQRKSSKKISAKHNQIEKNNTSYNKVTPQIIRKSEQLVYSKANYLSSIQKRNNKQTGITDDKKHSINDQFSTEKNIKRKCTIATIKIDLRELMNEDNEMDNCIEKEDEECFNYGFDNNIQIDDLIIEKQKVDKNGKIIV